MRNIAVYALIILSQYGYGQLYVPLKVHCSNEQIKLANLENNKLGIKEFVLFDTSLNSSILNLYGLSIDIIVNKNGFVLRENFIFQADTFLVGIHDISLTNQCYDIRVDKSFTNYLDSLNIDKFKQNPLIFAYYNCMRFNDAEKNFLNLKNIMMESGYISNGLILSLYNYGIIDRPNAFETKIRPKRKEFVVHNYR